MLLVAAAVASRSLDLGFIFPRAAGEVPRADQDAGVRFSSFGEAPRASPAPFALLPWTSCAAAVAALLVAAAPAMPARASVLADFLASNKQASAPVKRAKLETAEKESQANVLRGAATKAEETKTKSDDIEGRLSKAYDNLSKFDSMKRSEAVQGTLAPEEKVREEKLEKIRATVTADLGRRKEEAMKKAAEAEEIAKRIENLATAARAAAELAKSQVDLA